MRRDSRVRSARSGSQGIARRRGPVGCGGWDVLRRDEAIGGRVAVDGVGHERGEENVREQDVRGCDLRHERSRWTPHTIFAMLVEEILSREG